MPASSDPYALDLFAPELLLDPYRTYARLRANRWIHYRCPTGLCSVLSRYADVQLALTDPRFVRVAALDETFGRYDALPVERLVTSLLKSLAYRPSFDVIEEFAEPLAEGLRHPILTSVIGNAVNALLTHRDQLALLRRLPHPSTAIDELLRFDSPRQRTLRKVIAEVELPEGDIIVEGEAVVVLIGAANRDYQQFVEPDQLRLDRSNAARHLAFAAESQPNRAVSQVRLAATSAICDLLGAFPDLRLSSEAPRRGGTFELRRFESLRVLNGLRGGFEQRRATACQPG